MTTTLESANRLLETIPLIMGMLRHDMRSRRPGEVSVPQFRVLVYLSLHDGANLSDVSNHIGLMRPTMSKMVDGLVRRGWVWRRVPPENRRCVQLGLTADGKAVMKQARDEARRKMAKLLESLTAGEQKTVHSALQMLYRVFSHENGSSPNRKE